MNASSINEPSEKKPWGLIPILLLTMVIIPGLGALGIITWWVGRQSVAGEEVAQIRAEIRALGLPIDDASMTQFRRDSMDQNRSRRWMDLLDIFRSDTYEKSRDGIPLVAFKSDDDSDDENVLAVGVPFREQPAVDAFLDRWKTVLDSVHEVTEGSGPIWTEIQFDSFDTLLPYVDATRQVARLLNLEFENAVRQDDKELAMSCLLAGIGNARSMELEPIIISQLVSVANLHVTFKQTKFALEQNLLSPSQLKTLLEHLRPLDDFGPGYRAAIAGERAMIQTAFDGLGNGPGGQLGRLVIGNSVDQLTSLKIMAEMESVSTESLDEFLSQIENVNATIDQWTQRDSWLAKADTTMTSLMTPSLTGFTDAYARSAMELRLIKIAIGLRLHRHQTDQWPSTLEALDETTSDLNLGPITPVGPRPFGYRIEETGNVTMWGFQIETHDQTPDLPVEATSDQSVSERNEIRYLRWSLKP